MTQSFPLAALAAAVLLAGCSVAPVYQKPGFDAGGGFKEAIAAAESSTWKRAEPADALARGEWWTVFGDPVLDELQAQAGRANPTLQAGLARLAQARAAAGAAESQRLPQIEAGVGATRLRASPASLGLPADADVAPRALWRAQTFASYEIDLFGRVASSIEAAQADHDQAAGLFRSLLLAIQADVAQNYLALRGLDAESALLGETVKLREQALALVERRFAAGEIAELDVARAKTELAVTRSEAVALARRRAELEHALAALTGNVPARLSLPAQPLAFQPVSIPAGVPSQLLERRPDIAAAERAMAAANARIGVARAAWFPRLTLTGLLGLEAADFGDLARGASRSWALGPLAGTALAVTLFDGGRRRAGEDAAIAAFDETAAAYRERVLAALRETEDGLSGLRLLARQADEQGAAVAAAQRAADLSATRYRAGYVNYLEVIDAERQVLASRRAATQIARERALATVALIRALGGGWDSPQRLARRDGG